jgi:diguanylate cyclase (GGDEF)-like protein
MASPTPRSDHDVRSMSAGPSIITQLAQSSAAGEGWPSLLARAARLLKVKAGYESVTFRSADGTSLRLVGRLVAGERLSRAAQESQSVVVGPPRGQRSTTSIALPIGGMPGGTLLVRRSANSRPASELELLTAVGAQLASALDTQRQLEAAMERQSRAELLLAISRDISSQLDLEAVLSRLLQVAADLFGVDHAAVLRRLPEGRFMVLMSHQTDPAMVTAIEHAPSLPLVAQAFDSGAVAWATDYPDDPRAAGLRRALLHHGINTVTVAPFIADGEALGALALYHDHRHVWHAQDLQLLEQLAVQAASALRSAQNYGQMATWAAHLQSIQQLGARLTRLDSVREIGLAIASELDQLIDYHNVRVYRVYGDECVPVAWRGQVGEYVGEDGEQLSVTVGQGITGWVALHGLAQNLGDAAADERGETIPGTEPGLDESLLLAPMLRDDEVIGVIVLAKLGLHQFTSDDLRLLEIYAAIAAQAMANADAKEQLRAQSEALSHQLDSQRELLKITESLLGTLDTQTVLDEIAVRLGSLLEFDTVGVAVHDAPAGLVRPLFARGRHAAQYLDHPAHETAGLTGSVLSTGEPILLQDGLSLSADDQTLARSGATIVCPLRGRQGVAGVLTIERLGSGARFSGEEFELVKLFAAHVSIALQNAEDHRAVELRAQSDALTGLKNHAMLLERLGRYVESGEPFSLLMVDLDNFKRYNDELGHEAGNAMLKRLAATLAKACRSSDEVFRYGGDEFAVLLPRTKAAGGLKVADLIANAVHKAGLASREPVEITCSIGLAARPADGDDVSALILAADRACYLAKRAGRNRIATASDGLVEARPRRSPRAREIYPAA